MNAFGMTNSVLEYQVNWTERMSNPLPYETGIQQFKTVSLSEIGADEQQVTTLAISIDPVATRHFLVFYEVTDLVSDGVIAAIILYFILQLLVPTKTFLLDRLIEDTSIIQQRSHLMPKWHIVGDSIHEMVVVGKDHMRKR